MIVALVLVLAACCRGAPTAEELPFVLNGVTDRNHGAVLECHPLAPRNSKPCDAMCTREARCTDPAKPTVALMLRGDARARRGVGPDAPPTPCPDLVDTRRRFEIGVIKATNTRAAPAPMNPSATSPRRIIGSSSSLSSARGTS